MLNDVLIKLRKLRNFTQEDVAEYCHVSRQAVSKWEQGLSVPDIYNSQELCKLYEIDINALLNSDSQDSKIVMPKDKFIFGYTKVNENGTIKLPKECMEKMKIKCGDELICLGDTNQGIALVYPQNYEEFAKEILDAKEKINGSN